MPESLKIKFNGESFVFSVKGLVARKDGKPLGNNVYGDPVYTGRIVTKFKEGNRRGYTIELNRDYMDPADTPVIVSAYEYELEKWPARDDTEFD